MVKHKMLPLPHATVGEVVGLIEAIYSYGGKVKISFLAGEFRMEFDDLGDVIDMAELLDLMKVKDGEIQLTLFGEASALGRIEDKKQILRKKLLKVELFKVITTKLKKKGMINWQELLDSVRKMDYIVEDDTMFKKLIIGWGSYTEIFEYSGEHQTFTRIAKEEKPLVC